MTRLLVIGNDRGTQNLLRRHFPDSDVEVKSVEGFKDPVTFGETDPDVVVLYPGSSHPGLDLTRRLHEQAPYVPVILIDSEGSSDAAIEAVKEGAYDYLLMPVENDRLVESVQRALKVRHSSDGCHRPDEAERSAAQAMGSIVGRSPAMQEVFKSIGRVAPQNVTVLIQGESGTGKEIVARSIHDHSQRSGQTFLEVNCAAIPELLLESELFGHERGAFTGADERRIGKFEKCSGGTIFLDEIGDMSPLVQGKVLRLLQEQRFERVGGTETVTTDVRIIAATNRNLQQMVADGTFREDLYYRLDGFRIELPPLRERGDDLVLLIEHFLCRLRTELNKPVEAISPEAMELLTAYCWPGNIRELEAAIRQSLLQTTGAAILPEFLPDSVRFCLNPSERDGLVSDLRPFVEDCLRRKSTEVYAEATELMERYVLTRVLRETHGNQSQAARILGITRGCLRARIRALHISLGAHIVQDLSPTSNRQHVQPAAAGR